jgi:hypothetical protein
MSLFFRTSLLLSVIIISKQDNNPNTSDIESPPYNVTELQAFHSHMNNTYYTGTWAKEKGLNYFNHDSSTIDLFISIKNITMEGIEIDLKYTLHDGSYKDRWFVMEQSYFLFYGNDINSDIKYIMKDTSVNLRSKFFEYRPVDFRVFNQYDLLIDQSTVTNNT